MYTEAQRQTGEWVRKITAVSYRGWKAFYHTTAWERKRRKILERDHNSCQRCRQKGRYQRAVTVHHVRHLKDSNLMSLCSECHEEMHPEKHKRKTGYENEERW